MSIQVITQIDEKETFPEIIKLENSVREVISRLAILTDSKTIIREPPIDMYDLGDKLVIYVDLPGFRKENIKVRVGPTFVEILAEPSQQVNGKAIRVERLANFKVYKKINLPFRVKVDEAKAIFKEGILQILLTKLGELNEVELLID